MEDEVSFDSVSNEVLVSLTGAGDGGCSSGFWILGLAYRVELRPDPSCALQRHVA
jgi:hypothetical protein